MKKYLKISYTLLEKILFLLIKKEFQFMGMKNYIIYGFFQKIIRINSHVPWPVHWFSIVSNSKNIHFKNEMVPFGYSPCSYIQTINHLYVGTNIIHAVVLTIIASNHEVNDFSKHTKKRSILIGDNCWLGSFVRIIPGVELGNHISTQVKLI